MSTVYAPPSDANTPGLVGNWAEAIDRGERIRLPGSGTPIRDFMHVDDLSEACKAFADSVIRHGTYNIGGGRRNAISLRGLLTKLQKVSELEAVIDDEHPLPSPVPENYVSDLGRITQELGWEPKIALDEGLQTLFKR